MIPSVIYIYIKEAFILMLYNLPSLLHHVDLSFLYACQVRARTRLVQGVQSYQVTHNTPRSKLWYNEIFPKKIVLPIRPVDGSSVWKVFRISKVKWCNVDNVFCWWLFKNDCNLAGRSSLICIIHQILLTSDDDLFQSSLKWI